MSKKYLFLLGALSFLITNCRSDGYRDIRNYYFPLQALEEGLVYEYRPVNMDSLAPEYWYYRSFISEEGVFLTRTYYEQSMTPLQLVKEEMISNGMVQDTLFLYEFNFSEAAIDSLLEKEAREKIFIYRPDSGPPIARVNVDILSGTLFPFKVRRDGGVFLYKIRWRPPTEPKATITLGKTRRYIGDTTFVFQGKKYDSVQFEVNELFQHDQEGVLEQEFSGVERYAKKLGLVYYRKNISDDFVIEYQLADRYPMEKLAQKFYQKD